MKLFKKRKATPAVESPAELVETGEVSRARDRGRRKKRREKKKASGPSSSGVPDSAADEVSGKAALGSDVLRHMKRVGWLDGRGAYEPRTPTIKSTSVQAAGLHIAVSGAPTSSRGLLVGIDAWSGWPVIHDPFVAYMDPTSSLSNPNTVVVGDMGKGKSSFVKTWCVLRMLLLGRRVVVIDKKTQTNADNTGREGEYVAIAERIGGTVVRLRPGADSGGSRINILDPAISGDGRDGTAGQQQLLEAVLTEAMGRPITPRERKALRVARRTATHRAKREGRIADVRDVAAALFDPDLEIVAQERGVDSAEQLIEWGRDAGFDLEVMITEELAGLIDGPTSEDVDLHNGLTVFDISALPDTGPAIAVMNAVISAWLTAELAARAETVPTVFIVEEGWHIEGSMAKAVRRGWKLARGVGRMNVAVLQHISDLPSESPARAMVQDAETCVVFCQRKREDAEECVQMLGWPAAAVQIVQNLPPGACLLQIGTEKPILVTHVRSRVERELSDTDAAMASTSTVSVRSAARRAMAPDVDHDATPAAAGGEEPART